MATSLIDVARKFATEKQCLDYLEAMRWPDGVKCVECGSDNILKFNAKEGERTITNRKGVTKIVKVPARHLFQCRACRKQFSATSGTIFNDSHLPAHKWFLAVALTVNAKKGLSAKQLERDLDVNYRTAWYLAHRLREAMIVPDDEREHFDGVVECDETFIGGDWEPRRKRPRWEKPAVFGALKRGNEEKPSQVRVFPIKERNRKTLAEAINKTVSVNADMVVTDEWKGYYRLGTMYNHETVNHIKLEYVRPGDPRMVSTNGVEGFWSLFKRGLVGQYHQISLKHLQRYLTEFEYRFNNRDEEDIFTLIVARLLTGLPLTYKALTAPAPDPLAAAAQKSDEPF